MEPHWVCKFDLPNQGSNKTPKHCQTLKSRGAFQNIWGNQSDLQLCVQVCREMELHNEKVKKDREIIKRLIGCVIFYVSRNFHFGDMMKALDPKTEETT